MRCTCGQPGTLVLKRRDFPYCQSCFEHLIAKEVRAQVPEREVHLRVTGDVWESVTRKVAAIANRVVIENPAGLTPGCLEYASLHALDSLFETAPRTLVFPQTLSRDELLVLEPALPEITHPLWQSISSLEAVYPGTMRSLLKTASERENHGE